MSTPIPSPPSIPFLGHVAHIEKEIPMRSFMLLAKQYGEIYHLNILGERAVVVNSFDLLKDVCDEKKFRKNLSGPLAQVRNGLGDGLFTAFPDEPNWAIAHRLLMPAFGTAAIRNMFDDMLDVVSQLVLKWERFGPKHKVDPADDFTRMTLDAIALCSMSYRLNSFYRDSAHPFVQSMVDFLVECNLRANRPSVVTTVMRGSRVQYEQDIKVMANIADEIINDRKQNPIEKNDLLNTMLYAKDPKTGESLSDESIRNNLLTFLVAGHETTSGLLTFALYYLIKNPEAMRKLREEVDEVLGDQVIQLGDLGKLPYTLAVLREALRLNVPAAMRTVSSQEDTVIGGGKYLVEKGVTVVANAWAIQRDPEVWGADAEAFRPERMLDGRFEAIPPNAWQPFGFGARACIGRAFALQEAQIALACVIQRFDFILENPSYNLELKQSLTLKPTNFYVHAIPRAGKSTPLFSVPSSKPTASKKVPSQGFSQSLTGLLPMHVLYGSNTGTSESFAQRIASSAAPHGFRATLGTLDSAVERVLTDGPVVIVTASFEGQPADNAAHFVNWLENLKEKELANVNYAVFGCGNRDWARTYQRIPKLCDSLLEEHGGRRIVPRGEGDASQPEFFDRFDSWETQLWETLVKEYNVVASTSVTSEPTVQVKNIDEGTSRAQTLRQSDATLGTVTENIVLTSPGAPVKRHIEFSLPEGMTYRAGDYLAILPLNPPRTVQRAISLFQLSPEQNVTLSTSGPTSLPVDQPINMNTLLSGYVELAQPATTRDLNVLLQAEGSERSKEALQTLSSAYSESVLAKHLSLLDILEDHPDIKLPFGTFLSLLPSMRVRQYSISSSPLWDPRKVTLTVSIIDAPSISGRSEPFQGVASTFLASLHPGSKVQLAIRQSAASFHPPRDPKTPLVMFCSGTGLAPMRGFIQERALQKEAGQEVGKITLFFGCRRPSEDYLYSTTDLKTWVDAGVVDVRPAFSREVDQSQGCKYVQDRIWHDRADIRHAYDLVGAKFFTCGSRRVAQGVKEVLTSIIREARGTTDEEAASLFDRAVVERYATDVFE